MCMMDVFAIDRLIGRSVQLDLLAMHPSYAQNRLIFIFLLGENRSSGLNAFVPEFSFFLPCSPIPHSKEQNRPLTGSNRLHMDC